MKRFSLNLSEESYPEVSVKACEIIMPETSTFEKLKNVEKPHVKNLHFLLSYSFFKQRHPDHFHALRKTLARRVKKAFT